MYEDFQAVDHWTKEELHCRWVGNVVAIATRHADAVDVRFTVNGQSRVVSLPLTAWVRFREKTGNVITDALAAQIAGRYLKQSIENGSDNGSDVSLMTADEVLDGVDAVLQEAGSTARLPVLPVMR